MDNSTVRSMMHHESSFNNYTILERKIPTDKILRSKNIASKTWLKVELIPKFYPLEQSHRIIYGIEVGQIKQNLCRCFQALSIQANFKQQRAEAALLTPEFIEMNLYLWKVNDAGICIELQRRQGCQYIFHRYAKYILQSASGNPDNETCGFQTHQEPSFSSRAEYSSSNANNNDEETFRKSVDFTNRLIQSDRIDSKIMAMKSLCILTDWKKTNSNVSLSISRAIVLGDVGDLAHEFVMKAVQIQYMEDKEFEKTISEVEYDSDDDDDEYFENGYRECIRIKNILQNYGLVILSNALETLNMFSSETAHNNANSTTLLMDDWFRTSKDLLINLLKEVDNAIYRPHNACLAAKCLFLFCCHNNSISSYLKSASGLEITNSAKDIGKATNANLWQECNELQSVLCQ